MDHRRKLMQFRKNIQTELQMLNINEPLISLEERRSPIRKSSELDHFKRADYSMKSTISVDNSFSTRHFSPPPSSMLQTYELKRSSASQNPVGKYTNWNSSHYHLTSQAWCCVGDLLSFCNKYEFKAVSATDSRSHVNIVSEVRSLLSAEAPFAMTKRFPGNTRNRDNLWVCIGRCPTVEYQLRRIQGIFRRPLIQLNADKQRMARENFHLAIKELRRDLTSSVSDVRPYDRFTFEKEFHLYWQDNE
uniref:Uncharacterized protein n=1 Tax=Glossina palpalis gambiensis TaxID=67801 RepID=A0A1B0ATP2_9MUSC